MEYAKVILPKVCFWKSLFKKELLKCKSWANSDELNELSAWCYKNFSDMYPDILDEVFADAEFKRKEDVKSFTLNSGGSPQKHKKRVDLPSHSRVLV